MCIGGNSASTDRKQMLGAYGDLGKSFSTLNKVAPGLFGSGASATGKSQDYFSRILSGDPNAVAAATQPEADVISKQQDEARKQLQATGNRTGGATSDVASMGEQGRGLLSDIMARARGTAATGLERIGQTETGQGIASTEGAGNIAANILAGATKARQQSQAIHDAAVQQWAQAVQNIVSNYTGK